MKKKIILTSLALSLPILSACNNASVNQSAQKQKKEKISQVLIKEQQLVVYGPRCIGCGRCVNIAPNNFEMDKASGKSIVISQENINSSAVKRAIEDCPTQVISI